MVDRELRAQLPWSTAVFGHRRRLRLPSPLERLIRRLFRFSSPWVHSQIVVRATLAAMRGIAIFAHAGIRLSTRAQRGRRVRQSA